MPHEPDGVIDYGATPAEAVVLSGDTNTDALIIGSRWKDFDVTYSFIDNNLDYSNVDDQNDWVSQLSALQQTAAINWFAQFASVSGLTFTQLSGAEGEQDEDQEATIRLANGTAGTAFGYYPHGSERGGDIIFGGTGDNPDLGDFDWATVGHEIGHALGLAHGHEGDGLSGTLEANYNSLEYSIMTYFSYVNHDRINYPYNTVEPWGNPQTLMIYDIAAIQHLYGANFDFNATSTTYTFSTTTGEMFVNGVGQGAPGANRILRTIWDGNGTDTYDFSNYSTNLNVDLTPGGYSDLDVGGNTQRSDLGFFGPSSMMEMARGHVFNALQFGGDVRSLIERAYGGSGDDTITGNAADNRLEGNAGNDTLIGGLGDDYLVGGAGADVLNGGDGTGDTANYGGSDAAVSVTINGYAAGGHATGDTLIGIENLVGSLHDDSLFGDNNNNEIYGLDGRDVIYGYGGADNLQGGDEVGAGDLIIGGSGGDSIHGGGGDDTIYGGDDGDYLYGNSGRDIIYGEAGADLINGGDEVGDGDLLVGGAGNDSINGEGGNDTIYGGADNDTVNGGDGRDIIFGETGNDILNGGNEVGAGDVLLGGAGNDALNGNDGDDSLYGEAGADQLSGGAGSDILYSDADDQYVSGGTGYDYLVVRGTGGSWTAPDIEEWYGSSGDESFNGTVNTQTQIMFGYGGTDTLRGGSAKDYLIGGDGNDILIGNNGDDQIYGDAGADQLTGGSGSDILFFDADDTVVSGGAGYDYALVQAGSAGVVLNMTGGEIEYAIGGDNGDILSADGYAVNVSIEGGGGNDSLYAGTAGSYLNGGAGADQLVMGTVSATDHIYGGTDYIYDFEDGTDLINATLLTSNTAQGVGNFTIDLSNAASGWYGVGYEGGNTLWIQAGQGATIDNDDFIFPASGNEPAPESADVMSAIAFDDDYDNSADMEALVAEYDRASEYDMPFDAELDMYGIDAGNAEFIV